LIELKKSYFITVILLPTPTQFMEHLSFGTKLRIYRDALKLSQREVADLLSVKQPTYHSWENDLTQPNYKQIVKLAEVLKKEPSVFFREESKIRIENNHHNKEQVVGTVINHASEKLIFHLESRVNDKDEEIKYLKETIGFLQEQIKVLQQQFKKQV
jgi:transcriptional regulator with XRE-family HTH domain